MPKTAKRAEVNNFVKGLITEASPLNFPANASLSEENFELNRDGTRDRRLGMGYEPDFNLVPAPTDTFGISSAQISTFKWMNVNGILGDEFIVVQVDNSLMFFDVEAESISRDGYLDSLEVSSFPVNTVFSFASIEGDLVVAAGVDSIAIISYQAGSGFSIEYQRLKTRDLWGVASVDLPAYENDPSYRGEYDQSHYYNLQNQSWGIPRKGPTGILLDVPFQYKFDLGVYPSNTEVVWTGLQFQPVTAGVTFERVYTNLYEESLGADAKAPKGYYIIDLLRRGTSRQTEFLNNKAKYPALGVSSISVPSDYTPGGAQVITDFAGRIWYGGFSGEVIDGDSRSPSLSNFIFFSQLVKNRRDFIKCYQDGDPTSRENSDVVETDGGFVRVSGAKNIISLINLESHLIVIADNGVWTITGGNDYGFSATNYKVNKISSFGGISNSSVVVEGGRAFFWSKEGIYVVAKDQFGAFTVNSITETTIQTFYESIPNTSKQSAIGSYDPISKKIRWLYKEGTRFAGDSVTNELVLDIVLTAFYKNKIYNVSPNNVEVFSLFNSNPFRRGEVLNPVFVDSDEVRAGVDSVNILETIRSSGIQSIRYLTIVNSGGSAYVTFSYYNNTDFVDWEENNGVGVDAKAFLITGAQTAGDSAIAKQIPYIIMYFRRTEVGVTNNFVPDRQSGCFMRTMWDWSNTANSNKWSALTQTYYYRRAQYITSLVDQYDNGFEVVSTKNKIRGRGKAFSMYLETEPLKDCRILGWSVTLNGNSIT